MADTQASDVTLLDGTALREAIRRRAVSCREVMTAFLDRIERLNPRVNAIVSLRDRDACLADAQARDDDLAKGLYRGPLHGLPQAIKDLSAAKGLPMTQGSPIFRTSCRTRRDRRGAPEGRGRGRDRQDQHARVRPRLPHLQPGLRRRR
jgi:amidase